MKPRPKRKPRFPLHITLTFDRGQPQESGLTRTRILAHFSFAVAMILQPVVLYKANDGFSRWPVPPTHPVQSLRLNSLAGPRSRWLSRDWGDFENGMWDGVTCLINSLFSESFERLRRSTTKLVSHAMVRGPHFPAQSELGRCPQG